MAIPFVMPKLGLTMEAGTISEWVAADGAEVAVGDTVLVIATDKVETEVESPDAGVLRHSGAVGETFDCGAQIGWILANGEDLPEPAPRAAADAVPSAATTLSSVAASSHLVAPTGTRRFISPNARRVAQQMGIDVNLLVGTGPNGRIVSEDVEISVSQRSTSLQVAATPTAIRLAKDLGVSLADVERRSPDQRVTRKDVHLHVRSWSVSTSAAPAIRTGSGGVAPSTDVSDRQPMTGMRGTIAARMHDSLLSMAQLTLHMDADMTAVVAHREGLRSAGADSLPGYTDYVISAVGSALTKHRHVNSQIVDDELQFLAGIHIGMAVALDGGLIVPVVHDADGLSLEAISTRTTDLASRARSGKLGLDDLAGGTISVSTLGAFGVDGFTPVINPPNTAIVGVGRIRQDVGWVDGTAAPVNRMTLSLTWDHRAFDGAPAAEFCAEIRNVLEAWQ